MLLSAYRGLRSLATIIAFRPSKVQECTLVGWAPYAFFIQLSDTFTLIIVASLHTCARLKRGIKKSPHELAQRGIQPYLKNCKHHFAKPNFIGLVMVCIAGAGRLDM